MVRNYPPCPLCGVGCNDQIPRANCPGCKDPMSDVHREIMRRIREHSEDGYELANASCNPDSAWAIVQRENIEVETRVGPTTWTTVPSLISFFETSDQMNGYEFMGGDIIIKARELYELLRRQELTKPYP